MNFVPLNDNIVVEREKKMEKTPGGILLPDAAKRASTRGKVLAVGEGMRMDDGTRAKMSVKEGDHVLFNAYAGNEVEINGERYTMITEKDVLGILS